MSDSTKAAAAVAKRFFIGWLAWVGYAGLTFVASAMAAAVINALTK